MELDMLKRYKLQYFWHSNKYAEFYSDLLKTFLFPQ